MALKDYLTIGEVAQKLSKKYPGLAVSKIRYLEEEGFIKPFRTPSGYRKYSKSDIDRLEMILKLQAEHFYPLAVIKEKMQDFDAGIPLKEFSDDPDALDELATSSEGSQRGIPLKEAQSKIGVPESYLLNLENFKLIEIIKENNTKVLPNSCVAVAQSCYNLTKYGIEPRHLKMYATFADRETDFYYTILSQTYRHKTSESREKLRESIADISEASEKIQAHLSRGKLLSKLEDLI